MAKKEPKTNAMRMLERAKIPFEVHRYECKEFIDGITIADMLNEPYERVFKTLVTEGKGGGYFVFVIPIAVHPPRIYPVILLISLTWIISTDFSPAAFAAFLRSNS